MLNQNQILQFLSSHKEFMRKEFGVREIALFGSYAKNNQTEESDIDLIVDLSEPDFMKWSGLLIYLKSNLFQKIDLITLGKHNSNQFIEILKKEALYA
jgi:uncharacterized protein